MTAGETILVFNSGSSSLKFQLFDAGAHEPVSLLQGTVRGLGDKAILDWVYRGKRERKSVSANDHGAAARRVFALLEWVDNAGAPLLARLAAVGHRIVHGGDRFFEPTLLTDESLTTLAALNSLAPLHNPPALAVVGVCREQLPNVPMVAAFDTAFFHTLPDHVRAYALPAAWRRNAQPVRRYGFHGLAHRYMAERIAATQTGKGRPSRLITLQLGHGCSAAAIRDGQPVDTSMGFTPLEGLIMATRPGDLDAGLVLHLLEQGGVSPAALREALNQRAGLLGLSGVSADMQELLQLEARGHSGSKLAIEAFCHRARKYIGAYLAVLGGADAIAFGGGIGEQSASIRARICGGLEWCGLDVDMAANLAVRANEARITMADSRIAAYVIPVDEELLIARDVQDCLRTAPGVPILSSTSSEGARQ